MIRVLQVSRWFFTPFVVFVLLFIVSLLVLVAFGVNELHIRVLGYFFQLLGILYTVIALNQSKIAFNYPGMVKRIKKWFGESPLRCKNDVCGTASVTAISNVNSNGYRRYIPCDESIDGRISSLEEYVDYIIKRVVDRDNVIFRAFHGIEVSSKREAYCVNAKISSLGDKLKENSVGAVSFVEAGLFSVLVASLSLSFPGEIASFF